MDIHPNNTLPQHINNPAATDKSLRRMGVWAHQDILPARLVPRSKGQNGYGTWSKTCITYTSAITTAPNHSSKHSISTKRAGSNFRMIPWHRKCARTWRGKRSSGCTVIWAIFWDSTTSHRMRIIRLPSQPIPLRRGFESLCVYASMVEPRVVGDKIVSLLRIVPIAGRHGDMVTTRCDHVQYIPVMSLEFLTIETDIRDKHRERELHSKLPQPVLRHR